MKNNIWYISKYIAPAYAAKNQARGFLLLTEFVRLGRHCTLITSDSSHQIKAPDFLGSVFVEQVQGVEVHWLKTRKYKKSGSINRILSWLSFEWQLFKMPKKDLNRPDVVIVSSLSLLTILNGLYLKRKYKCKLIFEVRDIWPLVLTESGKVSKNHPLALVLGWVEKLGYRKSDQVVGTMPNLSEHIKTVTKTNISAECIPQVIDPNFINLPAQPLSDEYINSYIPKDKFIVCHAGSIGADNSLDTLFECARALKDNEKIHFLIVGEGDLKDFYAAKNQDLTNLTFAPRVEKNQVQSLLNYADVVYFSVANSVVWEYGQSLNKVIDYMLSGKPIVASYSGYPSMINEAECGVYVPAENTNALQATIEQFAEIPRDELESMGRRGKEWILKKRSIDVVAKEYLAIIDRL
ncbi:glycosyltransferase family 4 protein [Alcaligenes endophyticus]|uniref:Glycosyltransferase family 4 protein n=1 Tax=Alcaligenes endophyticus TaxID=1929088 RepID=A0ABT8EFU0_9BURK|nr:glycosyltransferase family 4 protein [Alcaligenes endophyticus]MCX5590186.1 glycosyltransferase family 4 protein [Alcaligenes endophyticus]MDN4120151.1 glycosyltransferase family 4 protein [Alcaligenes endophyticus]